MLASWRYALKCCASVNFLRLPQLKDLFFEEVTAKTFNNMTFPEKMYAVDKFIYRTITWKSDYSVWHVVGLLLTPAEVLEHSGLSFFAHLFFV